MNVIDTNEMAEKTLTKTPFTVYYRHPEVNKAMPCISFYTLSETGVFAADNEETITGVTVTVDVWARKAAECGAVAAAVITAAAADGWRRVNAIDLPKENDVYHKAITFYFECVV